MKSITAKDLAEMLGGRLEGDGAILLSGIAGLKDAGSCDVSFLANPRYSGLVADTNAGTVIVPENWQGVCKSVLIRVKNPDRMFALAAAKLGPKPIPEEKGIHKTAIISTDARIGVNVAIGPYCVVEASAIIEDNCSLGASCYVGYESVVGADSKLYPHVVVRERVSIGKRAIIHSGTVLGSDGFGYFREGAEWKKIPQLGTVEIGDDVEIGANVTVDRARFGKTVIESGVKIDNLVQIAHNVRVGANTAMAAQTGISGSTTVGKGVQLGGQAGLAGHVHIGDGAVVGAQAGVTKDVEPGTFVIGFPATPHDKYKKHHAAMLRVPALRKKLEELAKKIDELLGRADNKGGQKP